MDFDAERETLGGGCDAVIRFGSSACPEQSIVEAAAGSNPNYMGRTIRRRTGSVTLTARGAAWRLGGSGSSRRRRISPSTFLKEPRRRYHLDIHFDLEVDCDG